MLPKINRLPLRFERNKLKELGGTHHSPLLTAIVAKNNGLPSRFAVVISKKISSKAVTRNLYRRRILNNLRTLLPKLKPGHDVLLLPKKVILDTNSTQIQADLQKILEHAALL